jgi:hypothetical protein
VSADTASAGTLGTTYPTGFTAWGQPASAAAASPVDGTGWIPVKLISLIGGSPISSMPLDPVNKIVIGASTLNAPTNAAQMYRYACKKTPLGFEVDATLESSSYGPGGSDDKSAKDGGNNSALYEVGTDLTILPNVNTY